MKVNAKNERLKRRYFTYLKEAKQLDEQTVVAVATAIARFEAHTRQRDFGDYRTEQAIAFKRTLSEQRNARTGRKLSKATIYSTLTALKDFFFWLSGQPGFKSRLVPSDANYFKVSLKDRAIAKAHAETRVPSLDEIRKAIAAMPNESPAEKRDRALLPFAIVTGARDDAIASTLIKHVDLAEGQLFQDARDMRTKFAKSFPTYFFPVGDDLVAIVRDWVEYLQTVHRFGPDDPLFPQSKTAIGADGNFMAEGFKRACWANADPIRTVFKRAFTAVGLPYFNPHSFRKTLVRFGLERGLGEAGLKAWSQNLGHDGVLVTLNSYGDLPSHRQRDLIRAPAPSEDDQLALELGRAALAAARGKRAA